MLSLYFHIPFCAKNCPYCSFSVVQNPNEDMINKYLSVLHEEIDEWSMTVWHAEIKSIYFWWWTPNLIWSEEIIKIVNHCEDVFDCENVGEVSFECNPFPQEQIYKFIDDLQRAFKKYSRVRFSFGIQSLDNWVLENAWRPYTFPGMVEFLRWLRDLKQETTVFNFDFMSFGVFNKTKKWNLQLRTPVALEFFQDFVNSGFADSFSLYMLELFEHQKWKKWKNLEYKSEWIEYQNFGTEDDIYEEFDILKNIIQKWWYKRYEISNFAAVGKSSVHNRVYREMEDYIWLWLSAASFLNSKSVYFGQVIEKLWVKSWENLKWIRRMNTPYFPKYLDKNMIPESEIKSMNLSDYLIESFFLSLRTDHWIDNIKKYETVLVSDWNEKINLYEKNWYLIIRDNWFVLTDEWMNCYNAIVTELLKEI